MAAQEPPAPPRWSVDPHFWDGAADDAVETTPRLGPLPGHHHPPPPPPPPGWFNGAAEDSVFTDLTIRQYMPEEIYETITAMGGSDPIGICRKTLVVSDFNRRVSITGGGDKRRLLHFLLQEETEAMIAPGGGLQVTCVYREKKQRTLHLTKRDSQGICLRNGWIDVVRDNPPRLPGRILDIWGFRLGPNPGAPAFALRFRSA